jgi:hypothetical protein
MFLRRNKQLAAPSPSPRGCTSVTFLPSELVVTRGVHRRRPEGAYTTLPVLPREKTQEGVLLPFVLLMGREVIVLPSREEGAVRDGSTIEKGG